MMRKIKTGIIAVLALTMASGLSAAELSYNTVEVDYLQLDVDDFGDFTGFGFEVSGELTDNFFMRLKYGQLESDDEFIVDFVVDNIDLESVGFGFGGHFPVGDNVDFVASFMFVEEEAEFAGEKIDGDGHVLEMGIRAMAAENIEVSASIGFEDFEDENDTLLDLGAHFYVTDAVSIGLEYQSADEVDGLSFGVRFSF